MLKDFINLKQSYESETDDLLNDFYIPALSESCKYWRMSAYFSAAAFFVAAQGITKLLENDGEIKLILGNELQEADFKAMSEGYKRRDSLVKSIEKVFADNPDLLNNELLGRRLQALSHMIEANRLDIKIAYRSKGIFHKKVGILFDISGDAISFDGSGNETDAAFTFGRNSESLKVFPSWSAESYFAADLKQFTDLWDPPEGVYPGSIVYNFPDAEKEGIIKFVKQSFPDPITTPEEELSTTHPISRRGSTPHIPDVIDSEPFSLRKHQSDCLNAWINNGKGKGIFALATGAGKTKTAIVGAVTLYNQIGRQFLIIAVPYQNLADQWCEELLNFGIDAIQCYRNSATWLSDLSVQIDLYNSGKSNVCCAVVVNATLRGPKFSSCMDLLEDANIFFIGDECHHHGPVNFQQHLPQMAQYRIGLSATPEHYFNEDANRRLVEYYGDTVAEYSLAQAIEDQILTPYEYHIITVPLTDNEVEDYADISFRISQLFSRTNPDESNPSLDSLLRKRASLIGSAENKSYELDKLLKSFEKPIPLSLFYCGDGQVDYKDSENEKISGRQVETVSRIIKDNKWTSTRFTSKESLSERRRILDDFGNKDIDAIVAIKCLDEGIDIPACQTAFILASSSNPRQFIQRRGRILRKYSGKEKAIIFDFMVYTDQDVNYSEYERRLMLKELDRVVEFAQLANNSFDVREALEPILSQYGLQGHL